MVKATEELTVQKKLNPQVWVHTRFNYLLHAPVGE